MSGISHAMAACLAGQRDWRRVTIGSSGGGNPTLGYSDPVSINIGAVNVLGWRGNNIFQINVSGLSGAQAFAFALRGILPMTGTFDAIEVGLTNGQSRIFYPDPAKGLTNFNQNVNANSNSEWFWIGLPTNYIWTLADVGKIVTIGIL